jgi:hypothetical protein
METVDEETAPVGARNHSYLHWNALLGGAVVAVSISFVLITFGGAIGLTVAPLNPSWRAPSAALSLLSGAWVLVVAIAVMSAGGYVAGRMRSTWHVTHSDEVEFRDGMHGLVVWALAIVIGAALTGLVSAAAVVATVDRTSTASSSASLGDGDLPREVDRLFYGDRGPVVLSPEQRAEASRLLSSAATDSLVDARDRNALAQLSGAATGLTPQAAVSQVDQAIESVRARREGYRHAAIILAFVTAASAMAAAAAAWQAACVGGRHRDAASPPSMAFGRAKRIREVAR